MVLLEEAIKKLEVKAEDDTKTMALKAVGMGALEGLVIVGALHAVSNIFGVKLTK